MKKALLILTLILTIALIFTGCTVVDLGNDDNNDTQVENNKNENTDNKDEVITEPVTVKVGSLKGPTSIGLVKVMEESQNTEGNSYIYDFTIEAAGDALAPAIIKGELDIAAVPANLAAVLYNKTNGGVVAIDINTLGVLYIVENGNTVNTVEDLRGKTIYSSGKGNTPEYGLNYMLESSGLVPGEDVFVEYKAEHAECVAALTNAENAVAMLPQPFVTTAQLSNPDIRVALDVNKVWEEESGKTLVTGVTIARREFVEQNPEVVADFLAKHKESADYVNTNVADAAQLVEKFGIFKAAVAEKAIPYCQISAITGEDMKTALSDYLGILANQNASAVGGKLPEDDFYYVEK